MSFLKTSRRATKRGASSGGSAASRATSRTQNATRETRSAKTPAPPNASLMHGKSLEEAAIRANAAATLVFSQYGHYKVPKAQQIDHFLASIDL